jgi:hypothetical protein
LLTFFSGSSAFADGGVQLKNAWDGEGVLEDGRKDESPSSSAYQTGNNGEDREQAFGYKFSLQFSKNVAYARGGAPTGFIEDNIALISLQRADGKPIEAAYHVRAGGSFDERMLFYIDLYDRLQPLTDYCIVVEPGITAANGVDVSTERYVVNFRTDASLENGMTLYEVAAIVAFVTFGAAGIVVGCARFARKRREQ